MVEEWRRRHLRSVSSDLELPLHSSVSPSAATTPSYFSEQPQRQPYIPPSLSSTTSLITPRPSGVFDSDDAFKYVATSMLLLYENHKLSVEDAVKGILIPEECHTFTEALRYRFSRLPVFPEPGESSLDGLVRRIHGIFGATLESIPPPHQVQRKEVEYKNNEQQPHPGLAPDHAWRQGAGFLSNTKMNPSQYHSYQGPSEQETMQITSRRRRPKPLNEWLYDAREDEDDNHDDDDRDRPRPLSNKQKQRRRSRDRIGNKSPKYSQQPHNTKTKVKRTEKRHNGDDDDDNNNHTYNNEVVPNSFIIRPSGSRQAHRHFFPESPANMRDPPGIDTSNSPIRVDIDWNIAQTENRPMNPKQKTPVSPNHEHPTPTTTNNNIEMSDAKPKENGAHTTNNSELQAEATRPISDPKSKSPRSDANDSIVQSDDNTNHCNDDLAAPGSPTSQSTQVTAKTKTTSATDLSSDPQPRKKASSSSVAVQSQMSWEVGGATEQPSVETSRPDDADSNQATMAGLISWVSKAVSFSNNNPVTPKANESPKVTTTPLIAAQPAAEEEDIRPVDKKRVALHVYPNTEFQVEIARRKGALWRNEAEALKRQSFLWQDISDEICEVMVRVQNASNDVERQAYENYLEELQTEMQRWAAAASSGPNNLERPIAMGLSKNLQADSMEDLKPGDRYSITKHHRNDANVSSPREHHDDKSEPQVAMIEPSFEKSNRVVSVMAPRSLPEGYKFEARCGNEVFLAKVPRGGVVKGEVFASRMYSVYDEDNYPNRGSVFKDMETPDARWRDELFDCFHHGFLHPFLLNTFFCPHVALVQVMSRVQISCTGDKVNKLRARSRARNLVLFTVLVIVVHVAYFIYPAFVAVPLEHFLIATMPLIGMDVVLLFYFVYMVSFTRATIRREFGIGEYRCRGCEDTAMAVFCTCCTIGQMGRHTADYETYRSYCCTDTGLAKHIEVMV